MISDDLSENIKEKPKVKTDISICRHRICCLLFTHQQSQSEALHTLTELMPGSWALQQKTDMNWSLHTLTTFREIRLLIYMNVCMYKIDITILNMDINFMVFNAFVLMNCLNLVYWKKSNNLKKSLRSISDKMIKDLQFTESKTEKSSKTSHFRNWKQQFFLAFFKEK